jgi:integrase
MSIFSGSFSYAAQMNRRLSGVNEHTPVVPIPVQAFIFFHFFCDGRHPLHPLYTKRRRSVKPTPLNPIPAHDRHIDVDTQWIVYFNLAIYAGCRRGELLALTWKDIDFKTRTITIEKARARTKAGDITKKPKNKHSIRTITVPADCIHLLILWRKEQMQLAWNMGETWKGYYGRDFDKNFIFIQPETGLPMNVSTPTHKFKEILKLYNDTHELEDQLPDISLHELRHTSATLLLANGTDIETVSHRLGHSKASTTLDVYGHAMKKMDSKASDTLESILSGRKKA